MSFWPDQRVIVAGPFCWMTIPPLSNLIYGDEPPRLSKVEGVDHPGADFMRAVFDLAPGEIGVAMNQPKTVAYAIRMVETRPSDEILRAGFELEKYSEYANLAVDDLSQTYRAWLDEIKSSAGMKWHRPPDSPATAEE